MENVVFCVIAVTIILEVIVYLCWKYFDKKVKKKHQKIQEGISKGESLDIFNSIQGLARSVIERLEIGQCQMLYLSISLIILFISVLVLSSFL